MVAVCNGLVGRGNGSDALLKSCHRRVNYFPHQTLRTDRQDAEHILTLLLEDRFPRIWVPSSENRDLRQLLWHRRRMVQARTPLMRSQTQERIVVRSWAEATGNFRTGTVGQPTSARPAGVARSTQLHARSLSVCCIADS